MNKKLTNPGELPNRHHGYSKIDDELFSILSNGFLNPQDDEFSDRVRDQLSEMVRDSLEEKQREIFRSDKEKLVFIDARGRVAHECSGDEGSVSFELTIDLLDKFTLHNHPNGSPPSGKDVYTMLKYGLPLVSVVTPQREIFDLSPGGRSVAEFIPEYRYLDAQSWAVAEFCLQTGKLRVDEVERFSRRQHALLNALADRGFLCYSRGRWE